MTSSRFARISLLLIGTLVPGTLRSQTSILNVNPPNFTTVGSPNVTISFDGCTSGTLPSPTNTSLIYIKVNSGTPISLSQGPSFASCSLSKAKYTGTFNGLNSGTNIVAIHFCNTGFSCADWSGTLVYNPPNPAVSVTPDGATTGTVYVGNSGVYTFTVTNTGNVRAYPNMSVASCVAPLTSCSVGGAAVSLNPGESENVDASYATTGAGTGSMSVRATFQEYPSTSDVGSINVPVVNPPVYSASLTTNTPTLDPAPGASSTGLLRFTLTNTSQYTSAVETFNVSAAVSGIVTSCNPLNIDGTITNVVDVAPGNAVLVTTTCTIGTTTAPTSGWVTLSVSSAHISTSAQIQVNATPNYQVTAGAITPSRTEPAQTTSDALTFSITNNSVNTGVSSVSYRATCSGVAACDPVLGSVSLASGGGNTNVSIPFPVSLIGTSGTVTFTATLSSATSTATSSIGTTPYHGVAINRSAAAQTLAGGATSGLAGFQVVNTSSNTGASKTFTISASCTAPLLPSCSADLASITLADQGASAAGGIGLNYTVSTTGTTGSVTLTATSGSTTGNASTTVNATPVYVVAVSAQNASLALTAGATTATTGFTVLNTSTNAAASTTYTLTMGWTLLPTSCSGAPANVTLGQGASATYTLSCPIGAVNQSGTISLQASAAGVTTQTATTNLTIPPSYTVSVVPAVGSRTEAARTVLDSLNFTVTNTSRNTTAGVAFTYTPTCTAVTTCSGPSGSTLAQGANTTVKVRYNVSWVGTTGTVALAASSTTPAVNGSGSASIGTTPTYGVTVTAGSNPALAAGVTSGSRTFTVQNTSTNTGVNTSFAITTPTCNGILSACSPTPTPVSIAQNSSATVTENFTVSTVGTSGTLQVTAAATSPTSISGTTSITVNATTRNAVTILVSEPTKTLAARKTTDSTTFRVYNASTNMPTGTTTTFNLTKTCAGILSCSGTPPQVTLAQGATSAIQWVVFNVSLVGTSGTVKFKATGVSPVYSDSGTSTVNATPSYTFTIAALAGSQLLPPHTGSGSASYKIKNTSANSATSLTFAFTTPCTSVVHCTVPAPRTIVQSDSSTVPMSYTIDSTNTSGSAVLSASVVSPSVPAQSATTFVQTQPWYALAIVPATGSQSVGMGSNGSYSAQMKNISWNTASPITATLLSTGCKNSVLASCTIASTPLSVAQGITSGSTTLKYAAVGQGTETVGLSATGVASGGPVNPGSGSVAVTVTAGPLSIATRGVSPGMTLDRGDCVAIAAGEGAAMECGDLRVVHALPTNVTMNKLRTPLLLYNSRFANPGVVVQANVYYSGAQVPDTLEVTATLRGSVTMRKYRWGGGVSTCTGFNCRIAIVVPAAAADSTGVYAYTLVAVAKQAGAVLYTSPTITDTLVMVNRSVSTFGQGWWLDGLETVMQLSDPTLVLWIGGDGSSRVYRRAATDTFVVNPAYERRDTLFRVGTNWKRSVGNGAAVWFNNAGKHDSTVSILGHVTRFVYAVVGGKTVLKQLKFPVVDSVNAPRNYTFEYNATATALDSVVTSSQNNAPRAVKATSSSGSILALRDPDMRSVAFAYSNARMVTRTNKLADVDTFTYDNAGALRRSARNMTRTDPNAQPIAVTIRAAETVGATAANDAPRRLTTVSTYIDGPLPISDTTWFFVGPYGVSRIINAMGQATVLDREDARFPALITRKTLPNAFVQQAWYSARALLDSTKDINPLRDGRDARTLYTWHPIWDKVASITAPTGELTTYGYSAARATRITEDIGPDTTRRVRYSYVPSTQLLQSVKVPLSTQPSTLLYDATLGNLSTVTSAMGFETRYSRASTGLDSLIQTQVDNTKTKWLDVFTYLDRMGRDSVIVTNGPAVATSLGTVIAKSTRVDTKYDAGGNAIAVSRSQTPDLSPEPIGTLTSHVGYDPAGRVIADTAADGNAQRHWYDAAGNDTLTLTRRGDSIFTSYDAVNRVLTRRIPSARDTAADDLGIATISLLNFGRRAYPWFPTNADGSYVIAADTARFEYDALGNVTRADNADALVRRTYFPNGVLESEAQVIATWAQRDTTIHRYTINYSYDLSNRRLTTVHPQALAPSTTQNVASYSYNALGQLGTVTDILGNSFTLQYDLRGDRVGTRMPGNIRDTLTLDDDERTSRFQVFSNTQAIRDNMLSRDPGGRVLMSRSPAVTDSMVAEYSGLGHMVRRYWARLGVGTLSGVYAVLDADETFTLDAFADRLTSVKNSRVFKYTGNPWTEGEGTNVRYYGGTGRLRATDYMINGTAINHTDTLVYDAGGNLKLSVAKTWQLGPTEHPGLSDRAMYYGADGRLRASESRTHVVENTSNPPSQWQVYFEEYRYDAFGRRVAIRKRSSCSTANSDTPRTCSLGFMRRTVWDGNAELYEIQMPDDALAEEDTVHVARLHMYTQSGISADINPQYGRVAYAYELSVDRPVSLTRINYVDSVLNHSGYAYYPSFTVVPHWDWRDHADTGTTASGQSNYCLPSDPTRCVGVTWRRQAFAFAMEPADTLAGWYGTLIYDKEDGTGTMYRRNRYVDPASGRFTQEDPIGLAGGMNLYGFANGDPINFADPFGLDAIYVRYNLYPINVGGAHIPLWHSAVIAVDKNGHTRYYEYGRYDSEHKGEVRRRSVPDLVMGKDGKPTQESLNRLYDYVSKNYGHGKGVHAEYDAEADYQSVVDFAEQRKNDPNRKDYNLLTNSCTTFAHDAVDAGKKKPEEKKP